MTTVASFGERHFGAAILGHRRRSQCLVRIADRIYRHPGGTLPAKLHQPKDYKAMLLPVGGRWELSGDTVLHQGEEPELVEAVGLPRLTPRLAVPLWLVAGLTRED